MHQKRVIPDTIRQLCYKRDGNGHCQYPGCSLSKENGDTVNLHHVQNEQFGGTEDPHNLITLCDIHHKAMHTEFAAYYPDSSSVLRKMNHILKLTLSKFRATIKVDDAYDLKPYLLYLTGSRTFRLGQLKAIRASLSGKDVLLVTPTGTGKSVCYQLPGLLASQPTLVISPLKALMVDQVRSIWSKIIPATYINSDLGYKEKKERFALIRGGLYKFIFVAPERFYQSKDPDTLFLYNKYSYLVVDEAHAIDSWGIAFRPSYRRLGTLRSELDNPKIIALTATASRKTQERILTSLNIPEATVIVTGFKKDNIHISTYTIRDSVRLDEHINATKYNYLKTIIGNSSHSKTIIFVPTVKIGQSLVEHMQRDGIDVGFYHSKLDTKTKMDIQSRFTNLSKPPLNILVSTSAFGMGIDIPDIRRVIHWAPALSITEYTQQIGRAGRDGRPSDAHLFYDMRDEGLLRFLATRALHTTQFKEKNNYSDEDIINVTEQLNGQVTDMVNLLNVPNGYEWTYILDYFGEAKLNFWEKYGLFISNILIVGFLILIWTIIIRIIFN